MERNFVCVRSVWFFLQLSGQQPCQWRRAKGESSRPPCKCELEPYHRSPYMLVLSSHTLPATDSRGLENSRCRDLATESRFDSLLQITDTPPG